MSVDNLLINSATHQNLVFFLEHPVSCLSLIGSEGSNKLKIAEYISSHILSKADKLANIIRLDGKTQGISDIRELQRNLSLKTASVSEISRVVMITDFDRLGTEAQNSLLKTLEEPPLDTVILITITKEQKVLETIYSRVKKIYVNPVSFDELPKWLFEKYSSNEIKRAHSLSMGETDLMIQLLEKSNDSQLIQMIDFTKDLLKQPKEIQLAEIDKISKNKDPEYAVLFCDSLIRIFNAVHKSNLQKSSNSLVFISLQRLNCVLRAQEEIALGLNKKLALTRVFMSL